MNVSLDLRSIAFTLLFVVGLTLLAFDAGLPRAVGAGLLVWFTLWGYLRVRSSGDEVMRAANEAAMAWGAPPGLALAFCSVFVVRFSEPAAALVSELATQPGSAASSATAGFGLGVLFACAVVTLAVTVLWAGWWLAKR